MKIYAISVPILREKLQCVVDQSDEEAWSDQQKYNDKDNARHI